MSESAKEKLSHGQDRATVEQARQRVMELAIYARGDVRFHDALRVFESAVRSHAPQGWESIDKEQREEIEFALLYLDADRLQNNSRRAFAHKYAVKWLSRLLEGMPLPSPPVSASKETKDDSAGLIHQTIPDMEGTVPRPNENDLCWSIELRYDHYWIERGITQRCSYESRYEGSHTRAEVEAMYRAASEAMDRVGSASVSANSGITGPMSPAPKENSRVDSPSPPVSIDAQEEKENKTFARSDQPQLRACEADPRADLRGAAER